MLGVIAGQMTKPSQHPASNRSCIWSAIMPGETGIEAQIADTPDLAKVKAHVTSGDIQWDVFDCPGSMALSGSTEGFWEPLDKSVIDTSDIDVPVGNDYLPYYTYAGGIGWDPKRFPDGKHPTDFVQPLDVVAFTDDHVVAHRCRERGPSTPSRFFAPPCSMDNGHYADIGITPIMP